jgi:uncharacterized protein involved in type VI secretion and phage assembly
VSFPGLYVGKVVDVSDSWNVGRVKVVVPSVFDSDAPEAAVWARPCFPWGHFFAPDADDHVWVAFENADPSAPVWLGVWFPDGTAPAEAGTNPPVKRVIVSPAGHEIVLDDTSGSEQVTVTDKTGNRVELKTTGMVVHAAGALTIEAPGQAVTIKGASVDVQSG